MSTYEIKNRKADGYTTRALFVDGEFLVTADKDGDLNALILRLQENESLTPLDVVKKCGGMDKWGKTFASFVWKYGFDPRRFLSLFEFSRGGHVFKSQKFIDWQIVRDLQNDLMWLALGN